MGTGIVANAAVTLPFHAPGLAAFALDIWMLAVVVLLAVAFTSHRVEADSAFVALLTLAPAGS